MLVTCDRAICDYRHATGPSCQQQRHATGPFFKFDIGFSRAANGQKCELTSIQKEPSRAVYQNLAHEMRIMNLDDAKLPKVYKISNPGSKLP